VIPPILIWTTPQAEEMILYIARVSSNQANSDPGLLRYLIRNKHWSPFEMASMCIEINTSRAIAQQILRHRSFSFQEFSQRYATVSSAPLLHEARMRGATNRQSSLPADNENVASWWTNAQREVFDLATRKYQEAVDAGIANEVARFILPLATPTKLYMAGTLRSWVHYLEQRTDEHTQAEHREIALSIADIFVDQFPTIAEALDMSTNPVAADTSDGKR